ncbi:hypothetical protein BKA59DRAFT_505921 [Fusarium tricinctum]|uniref:Uncharacterized protein n=1 Tax=Fusarium tricinctum TaxID=61284 RepID=A0A8K0WH95_9HYPO|nr:hypothetical protein BKA59DRAFT_505921 [Fusarium tricinctum]
MPYTNFKILDKYSYQNGFGSYMTIPGSPVGANSPQKPPYGYDAQAKLQSWLYRTNSRFKFKETIIRGRAPLPNLCANG